MLEDRQCVQDCVSRLSWRQPSGAQVMYQYDRNNCLEREPAAAHDARCMSAQAVATQAGVLETLTPARLSPPPGDGYVASPRQVTQAQAVVLEAVVSALLGGARLCGALRANNMQCMQNCLRVAQRACR